MVTSAGPQPIVTPSETPAPVVVAASGVDGDGDGFFAGQDCTDADRGIRPGAVEIKGTAPRRNCDGTAEPFPLVPSKWVVKGSTLTLTSLTITQSVPAGLKVQVRRTAPSARSGPRTSLALCAGEGQAVALATCSQSRPCDGRRGRSPPGVCPAGRPHRHLPWDG